MGQRTSARNRPKGPRLPLWVPFLAVVAPLVWLGLRAHQDAAAKGYGTLDPATIELDFPQDWVDPRWAEELRETLAGFGPVHLDDGARLRRVRSALEALPFVAEAEAPRVAWPAGASFELRLRRPLACVLVGDRFLAVDRDGVILPGSHGAPPAVDGGYLPLIGPPDGRFFGRRPGDRLAAPADLDGLAIAASLWDHLDREERSALGRVSIEATDAGLSSIPHPGAVLRLEESRTVAFGRSPREDAPGELSLHAKWSHVAEGLRLLATGPESDWSVLDVRWDEALVTPRGAPQTEPE